MLLGLQRLVLLILVFSQVFLPAPAARTAGAAGPAERQLNRDLEQNRQALQPTPTPEPGELESAEFIRQRQYPQLYSSPVLLPDLRSLRPADFRIVVAVEENRQFLHFSTAFWNRGPGVVELLGREEAGYDLLHVIQVIYRADGTPIERTAGNFEFEGEHGHWHWENFSRYELWTVSASGLDSLVAVNDKVGFCLRDVNIYAGDREHIKLPEGVSNVSELSYDSCFWEKQGLSVGWSDIYRANIPGQYVEITGLPDGLYALKNTIDPGDAILELEEENNTAVRYIILERGLVRMLPAAFTPTFRSVGFE